MDTEPASRDPRGPRRILAVGHDAYRAGAQIAFLHVLRWLRSHTDADIRLVLGAGGSLERDYRTAVPTTVLTSPGIGGARPGPLGRARRRLLPQRREVPAELRSPPPDLVYANSVAACHLAADLARRARRPLVLHVHELEMSIRRFANLSQVRDAFTQVDRFIAVSRAVAENLVAEHGVDRERIALVNEGIAIPADVGADAGAAVRRRLGIPVDAFVVGGSGTVDWRKGPDVFLLVARAVQDLLTGAADDRPVHFVWVGGEPRDIPMVEYDRSRLGLDERVHLVGPQDHPLPFFAAFDTFFLSSREDPYPLVGLEAAALGLPVVCYADSGGMPEFVEDDAGCVVPYLDITASAVRLVDLARSEPTRVALGRRAAAKVRERSDIGVIGPQIAAVLAGAYADAGPDAS